MPKGADLVGAYVVMAQQVMDGIDQHRPIPRRHHEAVAIRPAGISRVHPHEAVEQDGRHIGHPHWCAGMAGFRAVDCVIAKAQAAFAILASGTGTIRVIWFIAWPQAHLASATRRRIIGVRISCMARSVFGPGMTMELARVIHDPSIIWVR